MEFDTVESEIVKSDAVVMDVVGGGDIQRLYVPTFYSNCRSSVCIE